MFSKKDLWFSVFTGIGTGLIVWRILNFLNFQSWRGISFAWLILLVPILWVGGVNLGYLLGRWISFFSQFGKFAAIGFTNAAIDFGVLNFLIAWTGKGLYSGGVYGVPLFSYFGLWKTFSFLVALVCSYLLNKYWAFEVFGSRGGGVEFLKFAGVAVVSILINVVVASYIVISVHPASGFLPAAWANVGAVLGSASALIFSFVGFKLLVFKS